MHGGQLHVISAFQHSPFMVLLKEASDLPRYDPIQRLDAHKDSRVLVHTPKFH